MVVLEAELYPHPSSGKQRLLVTIAGGRREIDSSAARLMASRVAYEKGWNGHVLVKELPSIVKGSFYTRDFIFHSRL